MSKLENTVAFSEITLTAHVEPVEGSPFDLEITSASFSFVENGIPRATLKLALGESPTADGGIKRAMAHKRAAQLEQRDKIAVIAKFKGHQSIDKKWEHNGEFTVFRGMLNRPAYSMGVGTAGLVLEVDHWLANLASTSALSYLAAPESAAHFTHPVTRESFTSGQQVGYDGAAMLYNVEAPDNLWGSIKDLFTYLAKQDRIDARDSITIHGSSGLGTDDIKNTIAMFALELMDKGKTMNMAFKNADEGIRDRIRGSLADLLVTRTQGSSMWEVLLSLAKDFMFSVIPTIYSATCAPVLKTAAKSMLTIGADEYMELHSEGVVRALPIRSVALYQVAGVDTLDAGAISDKETACYNAMVGYYDLSLDKPEDLTIRQGQILQLYTPSWMSDVLTGFSKLTAENNPVFGPINALGNVRTGAAAPTNKSPNEVATEVFDKNNPERIGNRLAQSILGDVRWANRVGSIQGRLRFDIAPGSPVSIEIIGKNVPFYRTGGDNLLHAHVYQVDIDIDASRPSASTTLHLSHMRTDAEQKRFSDLVMKEHPLYTNLWDGTGLLDGFA